MPYSLYDATVGTFSHALVSLTAIIDKSIATQPDLDLMDARLHEDMFPFPFQVFVVTDAMMKFICRAQGKPFITTWARDTLTSVDALRERIAEAQKLVAETERSVIDANADTIIEYNRKPGVTVKTEVHKYASEYTIPNVYFHLVAAYSIARNKGVPLGKQDYLAPFIIG